MTVEVPPPSVLPPTAAYRPRSRVLFPLFLGFVVLTVVLNLAGVGNIHVHVSWEEKQINEVTKVQNAVTCVDETCCIDRTETPASSPIEYRHPKTSQCTGGTYSVILGSILGSKFQNSTINQTLIVKGVNGFAPYVWAYGPSMTVLSAMESQPGVFVVRIPSMLDSGTYLVHVHAMTSNNSRCTVTGSPIQVTVPKSEDNNVERTFPLCQIQQNRDSLEGRWLRCNALEISSRRCTRTGWIFQPWYCRFHIQPIWQLQHFKTPFWLLIDGTSTTRGVWWALLDSMVPAGHTKNISTANYWKCWGVLDFTIGNVRITYRDSRVHWGAKKLKVDYIRKWKKWTERALCPLQTENENSTTPSLNPWAHAPFHGLSSPSAVVFESVRNAIKQVPECMKHLKGRVMGIGLKPRHKFPWSNRFPRQSPDNIDHQKRILLDTDTGIPFLDIRPMSLAHYFIQKADNVHYVKQCNDPKTGRHVCSDVIEMEIFIILHSVSHKLKPGKVVTPVMNTTCLHNEGNHFRLCMSCPRHMNSPLSGKPMQCIQDRIPKHCLGPNLPHDSVQSQQSCIV